MEKMIGLHHIIHVSDISVDDDDDDEQDNNIINVICYSKTFCIDSYRVCRLLGKCSK